jgi:hypothetical protein
MFLIEESSLRIFTWLASKDKKSTRSMCVLLWEMRAREKEVEVTLLRTSLWRSSSRLRMRCMRLIFIFKDLSGF